MGFRYEVPDYRHRQLDEALKSFDLPHSATSYQLKEHTWPNPDKELYLFTNTADSNVLVFLAEDYIPDLAYVKNCFSKEIDAELIGLVHVKAEKVDRMYDDHNIYNDAGAIVGDQTDAWSDDEKMSSYAVDFSAYYTGFMAIVQPHDVATFWSNLP